MSFSRISPEYNRGFFKGVFTVNKILQDNLEGFKIYRKRMTGSMLEGLIKCIYENIVNIREFPESFICYNETKGKFQWYKNDDNFKIGEPEQDEKKEVFKKMRCFTKNDLKALKNGYIYHFFVVEDGEEKRLFSLKFKDRFVLKNWKTGKVKSFDDAAQINRNLKRVEEKYKSFKVQITAKV